MNTQSRMASTCLFLAVFVKVFRRPATALSVRSTCCCCCFGDCIFFFVTECVVFSKVYCSGGEWQFSFHVLLYDVYVRALSVAHAR